MSKEHPSLMMRIRKQRIAIAIVLIIAIAGVAYYQVYIGGTGNGTFRRPSTYVSLGNLTFPDESSISLSPGNTTTSINASIGDSLVFRLNSSAGSTGYDWNVSTSAGIRYINYTVVSTSTNPGGPQVRDYNFRVVQSGNQSITLQDRRQFAPYDVTATVTIQVLVGSGATTVSYMFQANGIEARA
jgi:predicted secreted protein